MRSFNPLAQRLADERGVSLVELLVVIVLMSVVGGAATNSLVKSMKVSAATQTRFDALADLQRSVDRMTRELRAAAPVVVGGPPVLVADKHQVVVNVFRDDFSEQRRFTFGYCPSTETLHNRVEGPSPAPAGSPPALTCPSAAPILIEDVSNGTSVVFEYLDASGAALTAPFATSLIRSIRVTLRRDLPNQNPITVTTTVRLRNVR